MEYKIYLMESDNGNNWSGTKLENCYSDVEYGKKRIEEYAEMLRKIKKSFNSKYLRLELKKVFRTEIELVDIEDIVVIDL